MYSVAEQSKWLPHATWDGVKAQGLRFHETSVYVLGSGELEFEEFCILAARFLIEEDEEQMRKELKEAFRFYDREGECVGGHDNLTSDVSWYIGM